MDCLMGLRLVSGWVTQMDLRWEIRTVRLKDFRRGCHLDLHSESVTAIRLGKRRQNQTGLPMHSLRGFQKVMQMVRQMDFRSHSRWVILKLTRLGNDLDFRLRSLMDLH